MFTYTKPLSKKLLNCFNACHFVYHRKPAIVTLPTNHKFTASTLTFSIILALHGKRRRNASRTHFFDNTSHIFVFRYISLRNTRKCVMPQFAIFSTLFFQQRSLSSLNTRHILRERKNKFMKFSHRKLLGWLLRTRDKCCTVKYFIYDIS